MQATGTFEVKLTPQERSHSDSDPLLARLSIDKTFRGDLEATSTGEMLSAGTAVKGSAGYVALEKVHGSLHGRSGGFALTHIGTLNRGASSLSIIVVPDSGTGELTGLAGVMNIVVADGQHSYTFNYTIDTHS
jgi:hypothetical protein